MLIMWSPRKYESGMKAFVEVMDGIRIKPHPCIIVREATHAEYLKCLYTDNRVIRKADINPPDNSYYYEILTD